jgi:hypothetical protein
MCSISTLSLSPVFLTPFLALPLLDCSGLNYSKASFDGCKRIYLCKSCTGRHIMAFRKSGQFDLDTEMPAIMATCILWRSSLPPLAQNGN